MDMDKPRPSIARLTAAGEVYLPKDVRDRLGWRPGELLAVENAADGVLLRGHGGLARTNPEDVFGVLKRPGRRLSSRRIEAAMEAEARRKRRE